MTHIKRLTVTSFRSHKIKKTLFNPKTTIVLGKNGVGKTSLLEAVYIALRGTSFKGTDTDIVKKGTKWWRVEVEMDDGSIRAVFFDTEKPNKRKEVVINGKKSNRLLPKDMYPVVLFEPDDLQLLHGSPTRRRAYIDTFISQIDPLYTKIIHKYERALKQRNALLKQGIRNQAEYFAWNIALSEYGASIIARRERVINIINKTLTSTYRSISNNKDTVALHTNYTEKEYTADKLLEDLDDSFDKDLHIKHTTTGPHRHDIEYIYNHSPALTTASRGEVRTIILSLKFIEAEIIEEITNKKPIILLDDVYSELDQYRQKQLLSLKNQTIISTTEVPDTYTGKKTNIKMIRL
ncbi:DNA replication and repair protein RecF [Candidatus Saccharibacteria bacterium]|nr:DNA replication and repair protein RecF [Candidatus Saccharibacteria bacterium]